MPAPGSRAGTLAASALLWALALALFGLTFLKDAALCNFRYQVEPTEAGMLQCAKVLAQGGDPWAPAIAPESYNAYGLGFPWVGAQWHRLQPALPWLLVLRLVSALGALLCVAAAGLALREGGASGLEAAALGAWLYPVVLFPDSFAARPDAFGTALYLGALAVALLPGRRNAVLAGALGAAAFFFKAYLVLALPSGFLLLWVQGRRREAWTLAQAGLAAGLGLMALIVWRHPHYLEGTLLVNAGARELAGRSWAWAWRQVHDLGKVHFFLALGALATWAWARWRGRAWMPAGPARSWAWASLAAAAALATGLGGHEGTYLRYYDELLLPPLGLALFFWFKQQGLAPRTISALFVATALVATLDLLAWPRPINAKRLAEWDRADAWVAAHPFGLYPPVMASCASDHGAWITDTGHTYVLKNSRWLGQPTTLAKAALRRDRWLTKALVEGRVQSIVCGETWECPPGLEAMGYVKVDEFTMDSPIRFGVYVPRKAPPKPEPYVYAEDP